MPTDAERFDFLKTWNPNHFHLTLNDHNAYYETAEQALAYRDGDTCLPGEREKILATGKLWSLQVYPDTPIGFYRVCASTLEALIDWAMATPDVRRSSEGRKA